MTLNKREKMWAIGVGAALLALVGGNFLLLPYLDARGELNGKIATATLQQKHDTDLLKNESHVADQWKKLTATDLKTDVAQATSSMNDALFALAARARFDLKALKPDHPVQKGDFEQVRFQVGGSGNTEAMSQFLVSLEKTGLPMQIDELRVSTRKEGVDDLTLQMVLTTVGFSPAPATRPGQRAAAKGDGL